MLSNSFEVANQLSGPFFEIPPSTRLPCKEYGRDDKGKHIPAAKEGEKQDKWCGPLIQDVGVLVDLVTNVEEQADVDGPKWK